MNLLKSRPRQSVPLSFSLARTFDPAAHHNQDILTCRVYHHVARELAQRIFETELQSALDGGLVPTFGEATLEHYTPEGRFDRAKCRLKLAILGPTRFLVCTSFYLGDTHVTAAVQSGVFDFEDLAFENPLQRPAVKRTVMDYHHTLYTPAYFKKRYQDVFWSTRPATPKRRYLAFLRFLGEKK